MAVEIHKGWRLFSGIMFCVIESWILLLISTEHPPCLWHKQGAMETSIINKIQFLSLRRFKLCRAKRSMVVQWFSNWGTLKNLEELLKEWGTVSWEVSGSLNPASVRVALMLSILWTRKIIGIGVRKIHLFYLPWCHLILLNLCPYLSNVESTQAS